MKKQYSISLVIMVLCGAVIAVSFVQSNRQKQQMHEELLTAQVEQQQAVIQWAAEQISKIGANENGTEYSTAAFGNNGIALKKLQPTGTAVVIDWLVLERDGFAVVHALQKDDKPGKPINASPLLSRGAYELVSIAMPVPMKTKERYLVALYFDDNASKTFEAEHDSGVRSENGELITTVFEAGVAQKDKK